MWERERQNPGIINIWTIFQYDGIYNKKNSFCRDISLAPYPPTCSVSLLDMSWYKIKHQRDTHTHISFNEILMIPFLYAHTLSSDYIWTFTLLHSHDSKFERQKNFLIKYFSYHKTYTCARGVKSAERLTDDYISFCYCSLLQGEWRKKSAMNDFWRRCVLSI